MKKKFQFALCSAMFAFVGSIPAQQKIDLDELLRRHAAYLKKTETPALQSRAVEGTVQMTVLVGGTGTLGGTVGLASEGTKRRLAMKFGHGAYDREWIVSDGERISVDLVNASRRSELGQFMLIQDQIFKEGLFGGALSSTWPVAVALEQRSRMKYDGLKKVDGRDLNIVRYRTQKKGGDLEIALYFDPQTYCHVKTVYLLTRRAGITSTPGTTESLTSTPAGSPRTESGEMMSARQQTSRIRLEEEFDDFRNSSGYVVPTKWKIRLTTEAQQSRIWEWVVEVTAVKNNTAVDPKEFVVK